MKFELCKIFSIKIEFVIFMAYVLSVVVFTLCLWGIKNGDEMKSLYAIASQYEGEITEDEISKIEKLEYEKLLVLAQEKAMEEAYVTGELSREEYLEYRDRYHFFKANDGVIEKVYKRVLKSKKTGYIIDNYYNFYLNPKRLPFLEMFLAVLIAIGAVTAEKKDLLQVIIITKKGINLVKKDKLKTIIVVELSAALLGVMTEMLIFGLFDGFHLCGLSIGAIDALQSIYRYIDITIFAYIGLRAALICGLCIAIGTVICISSINFIKKSVGR